LLVGPCEGLPGCRSVQAVILIAAILTIQMVVRRIQAVSGPKEQDRNA
jgi:hypothetical protein